MKDLTNKPITDTDKKHEQSSVNTSIGSSVTVYDDYMISGKTEGVFVHIYLCTPAKN